MRHLLSLVLVAIPVAGAISGCDSTDPPQTVPAPEVVAPPAGLAEPQDEDGKPAVDDSASGSDHHYFHKTQQQHAAEWGYEGDSGPAHWGDLSSDYVLASTGKQQSPIDLVGAVTAALPGIAFDYGPSKIDLVYNGHTVEEVEDKHSAINVDDSHFVLQQFHFHAPSEHTVDGRHSAMEMHLVHKSGDGAVAVVGVLIEEGADNPAFDAVWDYLPNAENRERVEPVTVDASTLLPADHTYFRYMGSFTTPPCTEDVLWMILKTPIELSADQIDRFRAVIHGNNRPTQPLNGRAIDLSDK